MAARSRQTILAGLETVYGVDPVLDPLLNGVRVENLVFGWSDSRKTQPLSTKPTFGMEPSIFGGSLGIITFDAWIKGSGVAGDAPELGEVFQGLGWEEIIVAATSVQYLSKTKSDKTLAFYFDTDEKRYIMLGAVGSVAGSIVTGEPGKLSFSFIGHASLASDLDIGSPTWSQIQPFPYLAANFDVDGYAGRISTLAFDLANVIAKPTDPASADGFGRVQITGRAITGTLDPEETKVADYDWEATWQTDKQVALSTGDVGTVAGNIWNLSFAQAQLDAPGQAERENVATYEIPFQGNELVGDDDIELLFT